MLKLSPDTIYKYEAEKKLSVKFYWVAREIFRNRTKRKKNKQASTSTFNETSNINDVWSYLEDEVLYDKEAEILQEIQEKQKKQLDKVAKVVRAANRTQNDGTNNDSDYITVNIFLRSVNTSICEMSRQLKIPRYYLSNLKVKGQQHLKQALV